MPWKMDGDKIAMNGSDPIWLQDDGKETTVSGGTISRLNAEAKTHREAKEAAELKLKTFTGIDDPAAAIAALETVSKIDQKKLIDAGQVDAVKLEINKSWETKFKTVESERDSLQSAMNGLVLDNAFTSSKFITDNVAVPPDMFRSYFKDRFKVENGKAVPQKIDGSGPLFSEKRSGDIADVDEAFEIWLKDHPHKDSILKAPDARGSGNGGDGGKRSGSNTIRRSDWRAKPVHEQGEIMAKIRKGEMTMVD